MKQVHTLIQEGKGEAARRRLAALLAQEPGQAETAAGAVAGLLWSCYEQFHVQAVHDFCRDLEFELPAIVADRIQQALGPRIQRTAEWTTLLRGVTRERLVRECRDLIVHKELKKATVAAATLLERAHSESELDDSAVLLARGLATLQRDREGALTVIGYLGKAGQQARGAMPIVADQFTTMTREFRNLVYDINDQEWSRRLTEAILAYRAYLPGLNETGEPEPVQLDRFYDEAHACLRAGLQQRNREDFLDGLAVMMEYCPTDPPPIHNAAGVEERMFLKLGPRARLVAVRAMARLGEIELLRKTVVQLARDSGLERLRLLGPIMGGLRHPDFHPYLQHALARADNRRDESRLIEAIGRIGSPDSVKLLLERLADAVKHLHSPGLGKAIPLTHSGVSAREASPEERIGLLLTALGRVGRSKGLEPKLRNEIVRRVVELLEKEDRRLAFAAASEMFTVRLDELSPQLKAWAAGKAVEAMWGQPLGQPEGSSLNGWREPMVTTLLRLGSGVLPAVLSAAARHATRYGGAMAALANVLAEIGDERAVPLLSTMLRVAFTHQDDEPQSKLLEEKTIDAASGQTRGLDRDDLVHTLLYTAGKVGGAEGIKAILDYAEQVQGGRLEAPGQQTINMLVDFMMKHDQLKKERAEARAAVVDEKVLKQALAAARGGLLTRKATRVAAIVQLGGFRRMEAIAVLLEVFGDKDPMLAAAAATALAEFLRPLPNEKSYAELLDNILEEAPAMKGIALDRLLEFITRELPKNPPYDGVLERRVQIMIDNGELAHRIKGAMRQQKDLLDRLKTTTFRPTDEDLAANAPEKSIFIDDDRMARQSDLDKRRAYFEARRRWAQGGKVGEEPKPPAG